MPAETQYTITDLARLSGINVRTIRYYLAQGLLPASGESGPGAHYGQGHLDRLQLTKRLQEQHQPLSEIRLRLAEMGDDDVAGVLAEPTIPQAPPSSALDYVRSVLASPARVSEARPRALRRLAMPAAEMFVGSIAQLSEGPSPAPDETTKDEPPSLERSQWERLSLGPNVELHVRRPLSRQEQKRVERLVTIARQVLKEGS
jgi:DNA-binding transcriptional MerR regulator